MTGKTHMAIGAGATAVLFPTNDIKTIIGGTALALIGSLIVDIDTDKSEGSRILKEALGGIIILGILGLVLRTKYNTNILGYLTENKTIKQMYPELIILLIALVIGKWSSHRTFTHSLIGLIAYSVPIYILLGSINLYKWFLVGYIAHIIADLLNRKEVKILYPLKGGVCLRICSSDGIVDKLLFVAFMGITIFKYMIVFNIIQL